MDNDKIVSILKECIPSDMDKSDLEKISNQLRNVIKDKLNLVNVDLGLLKKYIDVSEEDYEELSFYTIMCDLQNTDYKLVDEQAIYEKGHYYIILLYIKAKQKLTRKELKFGISNNDNYYKYLIDKNNSIIKNVPFKKKISLYYDNLILKRLIKRK